MASNKIDIEAGAYGLTGDTPSLIRAAKIVPGTEAYAVTGANMAPLCDRIASAGSGSYLVEEGNAMYFHANIYFKVNGDWLLIEN